MGKIICSFITFTLEAFILWQYAGHLLTPKQPRNRRLLVLCILYAISFLGFFLEIPWLNATLTILTNLIFFGTQYKLKWYATLFHSFILMGLMGLNEMIAYAIIDTFSTGLFNSPFYWRNMILHAVFSKALSFMMLHIFIYFLKGRKESSSLYGKSFYLLTVLPAATIFSVTTIVTIENATVLPDSLHWMVWTSSVLLLVVNLLIFIQYWHEQKKSAEFSEMKLLLERNANSVEYYKMLLSQNENQKILIHDMKKHLQSIAYLNQKQEPKEIEKYIQKLMDSSDLREFSQLCDNEMLNMILLRYQELCKNKNIAFYADIRSASTQFISDADITSLFCNLLDNAMEAAAGLPNAFIDIHMEKRQNAPFVTLTVRNSCGADPFSSDKKLLTHKTDKKQHGIGIKSIKKTVKQYDGETGMYYDDEDHTFHTNILLRQPA